MSKTTTEMQLVAVSKLIPYVNNARTHSAEQIMKLRSSLREFGFINPVIIDREYNVIAGHGRILAAKEEGYLQTTEGNVVHYGYIEKFIEKLGERFNIREIAFDRWGAVQMVQNLEGMGFTVVPFGQGFKDMSPPTKELMKLTLEQKLAHGGHPVLRWMMDNIFIRIPMLIIITGKTGRNLFCSIGNKFLNKLKPFIIITTEF